MIIGVDCGCLGIKNEDSKGGIYNVARNMLESLGKFDKKNTYLLYSFYPIDKKLLKSFGGRMKNVVVSPTRGWMSLWLPLRINRDKPDIFIATSQAIPMKFPLFYYPRIITFMYDIAFEKLPRMYTGFPKKLKRNSRNAAKNSDLLIATSHNSKKDIIDLYKIKNTKIKVVYTAVSDFFKNKGSKYKTKTPYFLFVGAFKKTKNIPNIIKAFQSFLDETKLKHNLILVGPSNSNDEITALIGKSSKIKITGFIDEASLAKLYRGAVAFVSPSFYEGFGMSFLEAMKCGCPILGSTKGSIPEVVPNSAILVDPSSYKSLTNAMMEIANNLKKREKMVNDGLIRAKDFSVEKFGKEMLKVINE